MRRVRFAALALGVFVPMGCGDSGTQPLPSNTAGAAVSGSAAIAGQFAAGGGGAGAAAVRGPTAGTASTTTPRAGSGGIDADDGGVAPIAGNPAGSSGAAASGGAPALVPMTGTFPPITDPGADGPYTAKTVQNTGPNNAYTLFHPTDLAPNGVLNPIVSWGNGGGTTPGLYPMLPHLATHGFVVIASNNSSATGPLLKAGIDWVVQQNEDSASPLYHKLDTKNVSGVGYSLGGLATYAIADDPRFVTIVIISGANMTDKSPVMKLHTPTAYFCTADSASKGNCDGDFAVVTVPSFYGVMVGTGHVDVVTVTSTSNKISKATTGWLRWHQMRDQTQKPTFVGPDCALCKDSMWTVMQKNGLM